ncbi:50S ribosomal protein L39e [Candidatus Micrarchaeota archaeon]|nr:50S ribosomal protein L39e [Candidatus Micrarchaeota archaeon]
MSRVKTAIKKERLGKALKQNRRLPVFIIAKTNRKLTQNVRRRNWRVRKLKIR